mgnify:CR=1 FL=1
MAGDGHDQTHGDVMRWDGCGGCGCRTTTGTECRLIREDYIECLHHKKEFARAAQVEAARELKASGGGDDHGHGH